MSWSIGTNETPSRIVVIAVAEATNQSPREMEPLAETIVPTALDAMIEKNRSNGSSLTITFEYEDCLVTATSNEIRIDQ